MKLGNRIIAVSKSNGFMSAITKGERSYGKTAYNIKTAAYVHYKQTGCTETEAWEAALNDIIFTPDELINRVEGKLNKMKTDEDEEPDPVWIIDDAAVHFSGYLFFINVYQMALMNATFDTIRIVVRSLLINCPNKKRLMSGLKNYDDYDISIYKEHEAYERKAVAIKWFTLPDGHRKYKKEFEDYFSCFLPNWVHDKYLVQRTKYLAGITDELKSLRDKLNTRKKSNMEEKPVGDFIDDTPGGV